MHTTVAFSMSHTHTVAFQKVDAAKDQHIRVYGEKIYIGDYNMIIGQFACVGVNGLEARVISPTLRRVNPLYITPIDIALVPTEPIAAIFHPESPVRLETNEAMEVEVAGAVVATEQITVAVFLAPGAVPPVKGEIFTLNCAANVTAVLDEWSYSQITFPDSLPVGNYRVVGARVVRANATVFRFVPVGEAWRPGGIAVQAVDDLDPDLQRFGGLGNWFTFNSIQPPGIEIVTSVVAGAGAFEVYIDVIKV